MYIFLAAEKIIQSEAQRRVYSYDSILSSASSMTALDGVPSTPSLNSGGSPVAQKKTKRRNTIFSMVYIHGLCEDFSMLCNMVLQCWSFSYT